LIFRLSTHNVNNKDKTKQQKEKRSCGSKVKTQYLSNGQIAIGIGDSLLHEFELQGVFYYILRTPKVTCHFSQKFLDGERDSLLLEFELQGGLYYILKAPRDAPTSSCGESLLQ